jgi:hypothetical protein
MSEGHFGAIVAAHDEPSATVLSDPQTKRRQARVEVHANRKSTDGDIGEQNFWHGFGTEL